MNAPAPQAECNVIMKGGITSGVIYPRALSEFAKTYRFRSLGGASAGAIGAASLPMFFNFSPRADVLRGRSHRHPLETTHA